MLEYLGGGTSVEEGCDRLIAATNAAGGSDHITVKFQRAADAVRSVSATGRAA